MSVKHIGQEDVKLNHIRREIENTTLNSVRRVLPDRAIVQQTLWEN
jgi:hypothetical protein